MAKRQPKVFLGTDSETSPLPTPSANTDGENDGVSVRRLSIALTPDGKAIDWAKMRPSTQESLRNAIGASSDLGNISQSENAFDPSLCGLVYDALGGFMAGIAQRNGYTADAAKVLTFTADEKQALAEPTAKVVNKYAGNMGKYQDEIVLAVAISTIISGKLALLRKQATVLSMSPQGATAHADMAGETREDRPL